MSQRLIDAKSQQRNDADWAAYHLRLAIDALLAITHDRSNYSNNEWLKHAKAALTGKRKAERGPNGDPLFSEVNDALADIGESEWKANGVAWKRPNEDH